MTAAKIDSQALRPQTSDLQNVRLDLAGFLNARFSILKRVGEAVEKNLTRLIGRNRVFSLLQHRPTNVEKILFCPNLSDVLDNQLVVIKAKIEAHTKPANSRQPYKILCRTTSGYVTLVFFKIYPSQITQYAIGNEVAVLGHLKKSLLEYQISHPRVVDAKQIENLPKINVIYPLVAGVTQNFLTKKIHEILEILPAYKHEEWIDHNLLRAQNWPGFVDALEITHNPQINEDLLPQNLARRRLAYDEVLAWQLALLLVKRAQDPTKKLPKITRNFADEFLQAMPFQPTAGQLQAAVEIKQDIISTKKMLRLLQGDVGSGKTILAIYAALLAFAQGKQSCVIVPIAILADQHFTYFKKMLAAFGPDAPRVELLLGKNTKKQKAQILQDLAEGKIDILISTHAVLQDDVKFKNLALVVIDEQHRFGVMQRLKLVEKGQDVDVLLMSATPIPRSLMMAIYADMDISILSEKPAGRKEIETLVMSQSRQGEVIAAVKRALAKGNKIYWICPAIEKPEEEEDVPQEFDPLQSAEEKYEELQGIFGASTVALIHGKMKDAQKDAVMESFVTRRAIPVAPQILVATTVIEVGVDVKDATIIIIEDAQNFGLSQLHQLRGRVGRGEKQSYCILLYGKKYGEKGKQRLGILRQSTDGFYIAEEDLKMRGSGELLGTRQSGVPEFKLADMNNDGDLLKIAHKNAQVILNENPDLQGPTKKYRDLLKLFDYDECLKILGGG